MLEGLNYNKSLVNYYYSLDHKIKPKRKMVLTETIVKRMIKNKL